MSATRTIASNCLQRLGARMFAVFILEPVSDRRSGPDHLKKVAADPWGIWVGRGTSQTGCTAVCGDRSGPSPPGTGEKQDPHSLITKPYRIVLFWSTTAFAAWETPFSRNCQREGRRRMVALGLDWTRLGWPERTGQEQPDRRAHPLFGGLHLHRRSERRHAVSVTDDDVEKHLSRDAWCRRRPARLAPPDDQRSARSWRRP